MLHQQAEWSGDDGKGELEAAVVSGPNRLPSEPLELVIRDGDASLAGVGGHESLADRSTVRIQNVAVDGCWPRLENELDGVLHAVADYVGVPTSRQDAATEGEAQVAIAVPALCLPITAFGD